jgi:hypothetical protein
MGFVYAHFATVLSPGWEDFEQARALWRILERDGEQEAFVDNVVAHLKSAVPPVQQGAVGESPQGLLLWLSDEVMRPQTCSRGSIRPFRRLSKLCWTSIPRSRPVRTSRPSRSESTSVTVHLVPTHHEHHRTYGDASDYIKKILLNLVTALEHRHRPPLWRATRSVELPAASGIPLHAKIVRDRP